MEQSPSLCEQLYEASLVLLEVYGDEPQLTEEQVCEFKHSGPFRNWLYVEIMRISVKQDRVPDRTEELIALSDYADIMAGIILRAITNASILERIN
jgi:hypothetical protein